MSNTIGPSSLLKKRIPFEVYRLATAHQVGDPIARYDTDVTNVLIMLCGLMAGLDGGMFMRGEALFLSILLSSATSDKSASVLGSSFGVSWLGLGIALIFVFFGLTFFIYGFKQLFRRSRTYECTQGFMELQGAHTVVVAMRWDQIVRVQQVLVEEVGYRSKIRSQRYFAIGREGEIQEIEYSALRRRIEQQVKHLSFEV